MIKKIKAFIVDRQNGRQANHYIIPNNGRAEEHKQWIIDNCTGPDEPLPIFHDVELPVVIDNTGWYASAKDNLWYIEILRKGEPTQTIFGYKIGSIMIDRKKAESILNRKRNAKNSKICHFDVTGRDSGMLDILPTIVSKFEF